VPIFRGGLTSGNNYVLGDQEGKTYIVTGANSGIGRELTMELAMKKARVIMACR
jgi:short-subunit dehydrogenase